MAFWNNGIYTEKCVPNPSDLIQFLRLSNEKRIVWTIVLPPSRYQSRSMNRCCCYCCYYCYCCDHSRSRRI